MCRRVVCQKCGKPTFAGCGAHVEQVLADVPVAERCHCRDEAVVGEKEQEVSASRSWLDRFRLK